MCNAGQTHFADQCNSTAGSMDRTDSICRSTNASQSGCTADAQCNGVIAGTSGCDSGCHFTYSCSYIGVGDWWIQGADACTLGSSTNLLQNELFFNGSGVIQVNTSLYNWSSITAQGGVDVQVLADGSLW